MNRFKSKLFWICLLTVCLPVSAKAADSHVVVISIDGLPGYLIDDPQASLPVIRGLAASGVMAKDGMNVSNPSVTWPNHTTLMTGVHPERHGVLFNGGLERSEGGKLPVRVNPMKLQRDLVTGPLLFDRLKQAGQSSAAINWPCTAKSESIDDNFPDSPNTLRFTTQRLKDDLASDGLLKRWEAGGVIVRDEIWTEAACRVIRQHKPRLLALHLLNTDSTHHRYGPKSPPGYSAVALADALVGKVLKALDDAGIRDKTTIFIVSDHGFAAVPKSIKANLLLERQGFITLDKGQIVSAKAQVIPEGGIGMLYFAPETSEEDRQRIRSLFEKTEGVAAVLAPTDFPRYHLPVPTKHEAMADLVIAAKDGYDVAGTLTGDSIIVENEKGKGAHGFLSTEPKMRATFVASGAKIKKGVPLKLVDNTDLAPTIARILGVPLPDPTGRVISEIITVHIDENETSR